MRKIMVIVSTSQRALRINRHGEELYPKGDGSVEYTAYSVGAALCAVKFHELIIDRSVVVNRRVLAWISQNVANRICDPVPTVDIELDVRPDAVVFHEQPV